MIKAGAVVWDLDSTGLEAAAAVGNPVEVLLPLGAMEREIMVPPAESVGRMM